MATLTPASSSPTSQSTTNMYRVGDYVYFENSASNSYAIRRIEELNKTPNGNVEARVMCFYRRSELPPNLIAQADRHHFGDEIDPDSDEEDTPGASKEKAERQEMKLREVFLSRQVETLPATLIRGKCSVTLLSEVETAKSYTSREDAFFYALVFDPHQKTLVADRGEIRIGSGYQATVPPLLGNNESDPRDKEDLADMIWDPENKLNDSDIDKFLIVSRSVGTFARALDCSSSVKQPSLHMSAAAASRDITLFQAHDLLHKHKYDYASAVKSLVPTTGPMLCRDEMEDWSASEANLFEEAIEKYGKDFNDIKKDFLPWKSMKNIIEYFFMWKTTDRYVQQKRIKAMEAESKLKQVYVPPYTNKTSRLTGSNGEVIIRGRDCDAYPKLEKYSWVQYKKYGKFLPATMIDDCFILDKSLAGNAMAARLTQLRPGLIIEPGSPAAKPGQSGKTRTAFYLRTTPITRAARRVLPNMRLRYYARRTGKAIDMKAAKEDVKKLMVGMSETQIRKYNSFSKKDRVNMSVVVKRLGQNDDSEHQWLVLTPKSQIPKPEKEFFPRPSKRPDGSYIYERIPGHNDKQNQHQQLLYKKRAYDENKPAPEPVVPTKFQRSDHYGRGGSIPVRIPRDHEAGPKGRIATLTRVAGGHKQIISWMDAPDDVFFKANPTTKKLRRKLSVTALRKAARKPFKKVLSLPGAGTATPAGGTVAAGITSGATTVTPVLL